MVTPLKYIKRIVVVANNTNNASFPSVVFHQQNDLVLYGDTSSPASHQPSPEASVSLPAVKKYSEAEGGRVESRTSLGRAVKPPRRDNTLQVRRASSSVWGEGRGRGRD